MSGPSAYSNAQGTYVAFYALPPCFVSLTPTTTLTAELRFSAFDPNAASYGGMYYTNRQVYDHWLD
jgi:hypothetical protein